MGARISPGFTIIETVLFLAVTGLLVLGVLIGTGSALGTQRYRDSVESFKDLLQTQYAELGSVKNSRSNMWNCNAAAVPSQIGTRQIRGQSDCLLVGRYMRIEGGDVTTYQVLAVKTRNLAGNDVEKLDTNYTYNVDTSSISEGTLEWGSQIGWPEDWSSPQIPRSLGILFIRSPDSGGIYTFSSSSVPDKSSINQSTFEDLIAAGPGIPGQGGRTICILDSALAPAGDTSVYINPYAASASAIEVRSNDYVQSIGGSTKC